MSVYHWIKLPYPWNKHSIWNQPYSKIKQQGMDRKINSGIWRNADALWPLFITATLQLCSVQFGRVRLFVTPWTAARQASCPSPTPRAWSNACSLSQWFHSTISSSVVPFSSCFQSFHALDIHKVRRVLVKNHCPPEISQGWSMNKNSKLSRDKFNRYI